MRALKGDVVLITKLGAQRQLKPMLGAHRVQQAHQLLMHDDLRARLVRLLRPRSKATQAR